MKVQQFNESSEMVLHAIRPKWMVVDDNEAVLQMTAEMLAMFSDVEICCYQSPADAVRAFAAEPSAFELVVTDFDMPKMNGAELCRRLRQIEPELKIILTSGSAAISTAKALRLGFDAFLAKSFSINALCNSVETKVAAQTFPTGPFITQSQTNTLRPERVVSAK